MCFVGEVGKYKIGCKTVRKLQPSYTNALWACHAIFLPTKRGKLCDESKERLCGRLRQFVKEVEIWIRQSKLLSSIKFKAG